MGLSQKSNSQEKERMRTSENDASQKNNFFPRNFFVQGGEIQAEQQSLVYLITSSWIPLQHTTSLSLIHTHTIGQGQARGMRTYHLKKSQYHEGPLFLRWLASL